MFALLSVLNQCYFRDYMRKQQFALHLIMVASAKILKRVIDELCCLFTTEDVYEQLCE